MERPRAPRSPGSALVRSAIARVAIVRVAVIAIALAAGPGVSALGVARSMRFRARPYLLVPAGASPAGLPTGGVAAAAREPAAGTATRTAGATGAPKAPARARPRARSTRRAGTTPRPGSTRRTAGAPPALSPLPVPPTALPESVLQSDARSCGPAALATVLAWQGRPVGESAVLARSRLRADGVTLAELARLAAAFDLPGSWYAVPPRDLARLPTPFLAHLRTDGGHYVAVAGVARGYVLLADPALGIELLRAGAFRRAWSGRVLLFRTVRQGSAR